MTAPSLGRVLIVDDEVELMTALCESLTDQGYEALGRTSAQEALGLLQEEDVDLLAVPELPGDAARLRGDRVGGGLERVAEVTQEVGRAGHSQGRVQLVHVAVRRDARVVLGHAAAPEEAGFPLVTRAGVDLHRLTPSWVAGRSAALRYPV